MRIKPTSASGDAKSNELERTTGPCEERVEGEVDRGSTVPVCTTRSSRLVRTSPEVLAAIQRLAPKKREPATIPSISIPVPLTNLGQRQNSTSSSSVFVESPVSEPTVSCLSRIEGMVSNTNTKDKVVLGSAAPDLGIKNCQDVRVYIENDRKCGGTEMAVGVKKHAKNGAVISEASAKRAAQETALAAAQARLKMIQMHAQAATEALLAAKALVRARKAVTHYQKVLRICMGK